MRILILSNSIGSLINFRYELLQALVERGDEVFLASQIEAEASPKVLIDLGCKFIETEMNQRGTNPIDELKLINTYNKIIGKVHPSIVIAYTIKPNIYGSVACRRMGVPVIANVTGLGMALDHSGILQRITVWLYRWGFKRTDYVFFQNEENRDFFKKHKIRAKAQSVIHGSGVNLDKFHFIEYPTDNGELYFLYVGRILSMKGMKQLIDAAMYFQESQSKVRFHIVGIKEDPYYTQLILELDKKGVLKYHGKQSDIRPFIQKAHCLVHPSYYPEGLSNVCLEASAMGRPVITTDKSGCKETVDNGVTGYIVKQKDSQDLIDKIEQFVNLPYKKKAEMGWNAHQKVSEQFNRVDVVKKYLEIIDALVQKTTAMRINNTKQ